MSTPNVQRKLNPIATITNVAQLIFHNRSVRYKRWPIQLLFQLVRKYNEQTMSNQTGPKFKLVPLPQRIYTILTQGEFLQSDHYVFVSDTAHKKLITKIDDNWFNLVFLTSDSETKSVVNAANIVSAILKKPNPTMFVPVLTFPPNTVVEPDCVFVSENCYQNCISKYKLDDGQPIFVKFQKINESQRTPQLANKATIFTINNPYETTSDLVSEILERYFETPRILYRNYTYEILLSPQLLGSHLHAKHLHIFCHLRKLYFRCVHLETEDNPFEICSIVVKNLSTMHQTSSINMAIPRQQIHDLCPKVSMCPGGLNKYCIALKNSIMPFTNRMANTSSDTNTNNGTSYLTALPVFLIQGNRGAGKTSVLNCVAKELGLQLFNINCVDVVSQIASQTEAKLRIALSRSKNCDPLIIALFNFEIFGLDNEGKEDPRSIALFETEIRNIFDGNEHQFPVVVVAVSNVNETKPLIRRIFLDTINVAPLNKEERFDCLQWMHLQQQITENVLNERFADIRFGMVDNESIGGVENDIQDLFRDIAEKTPGFFYGDLKHLFANSVYDMKRHDKAKLSHSMFEHNLSVMQASFSDSLGAPKVPKVLWSDIGGLAKLKEEVQSSIGLPLKHLHLMGKNLGRSGILLYGPPGTGKTLVAKAVATECNLSFLSVQGPELLNMYVGQSEQNVREVFARARSAAPCVIFLDELDSLAPNRGMSGDSGGVMDRVVSQLMTEMNGLSENMDPQKQIFILAATNRPDLIDPSLLRPGRFDKLLYVGPCTTTEEKLAILDTQLKKFTLDPSANPAKIADMLTQNMTGADMYSICSNAWLSAVRRTILGHQSNKETASEDMTNTTVVVIMDDFKKAISNFVPSVNKKDMEYFIKLRASYSVAK